ncbi:MAG: M20/M25/M40 family metallo-hydrolase, partial [Pseudomonadota bacterium]
MSAPLEHILADLEALVAFDTRNPPRDLTVEAPLFRWLNDRVPGFTTEVLDFGDGCLGWYARRGETETLFNVHLDTVPVAPGWTRDPFTLLKGDDRATGLGACDIKGAAACLLSVAEATDAPMAFLFTTDEEAGKSDAVHGFLRTDHPYNRVIVAEPTEVQAVPQHRGIISAEVQFSGTSGHASGGGASAVHAAAAFVTKALGTDWAKENRLNFGRIEGGVKP